MGENGIKKISHGIVKFDLNDSFSDFNWIRDPKRITLTMKTFVEQEKQNINGRAHTHISISQRANKSEKRIDRFE